MLKKISCIVGWILFCQHGLSQTISAGPSGSLGIGPSLSPNVQQGDMQIDPALNLFTSFGFYGQALLFDKWMVRLSGHFVQTRGTFAIAFDPAKQPEVPFVTDSRYSLWLTAHQAEIRVGYKISSTSKWGDFFIYAGVGLRNVPSGVYIYSFSVVDTQQQATTLFKSRTADPGGIRRLWLLGAERKITIRAKYALQAGIELQGADSPEARGSYEFFPARTVSYSSGTFRVSSFSASLRITAPLLWWNKRT